MDLGLKGKKVLISAATRGVGLVSARTFLEEGAVVSICGRRPGKGKDFDAGAQGKGHPLAQKGVEDAVEYLSQYGEVYGAIVDCAKSDEVTRWVTEAAEKMGGIDIAVSNASALGGIPRAREGWDTSYNVDLYSAVAIFEAALPHFRASGGGAFVQMSTITAIENHAFADGGFSYGAMKAAVINYVHQLSQEYMKEGIRCNCVCPGPTYIEDGSWGFLKDFMPDYYEANKKQHPAGRFGKPEEIANSVAFLASEKASWISGVNLTVDGGYTRGVKY